MKRELFISITLILACITFTSCEDEPNGGGTSELKSINLTEGELVVAKQNNQFAWDIFSHVNAEEGNTIVSPLSATFAMCMTANGANGATREEIYKAFGFENCNSDDVNSYMQKLSTQLMSLDPKTTVAIANSLWHNKSYNIFDSYISSLESNYDAEVKPLGTNAVDDINNWCSKKTNGYINNLLEPGDVSELTAFVLANALYFNGEWNEKFDKKDTFKGNFYSSDNNTSVVEFMSGDKNIGYKTANTFTMASLYFGNKSFIAQFILPNKGKSFKDCINEIKTSGWEEISYKNSITEVTVEIPKFTLKKRLEMTSLYQQMGITSAFDRNLADFSNMSTNLTSISNAYQSNYFKVDENGATATSASNVTGGYLANGIPPFILNRPFIFALTERSTGAILFIGKIEKL